MNYCELKIGEFLEKLSSADSMPGGGVASSLVAANGMSLVLMVCNLSLGKEKYKEHEELIKKSIIEAIELKKKFLSLMDKDAEVFKTMEAVFAMPNGSEEEKATRKIKMQEACKKCCVVPKEIIESARKGIDIIDSLYGKSNKSAESDLVVGKKLLKAAIEGAWENIAINLKYIDCESFKEEYRGFYDNIVNF